MSEKTDIPIIENNTPYVVDFLFMNNEDGTPVCVVIVKSTFIIGDDLQLFVDAQQTPLCTDGEFYGDPDISSYKYEPETAFIKPASDVVLIGHAVAPNGGAKNLGVLFQVGSMKKAVTVTGDRYWMKSFGSVFATEPQNFEKIPLKAELAFGGWDRTHPDQARHSFEPRNLVGTGYCGKYGRFKEGIRLPNIEYPHDRMNAYGDKPLPAILGFTSPSWQPRVGYSGTYDSTWAKNRMPLLPKDFDCRFFNAAPWDQVVPGFLKGDESVTIINASSRGRLDFQLPGLPAPIICVRYRSNNVQCPQAKLDTLIVNTDEDRVFLIWRSSVLLKRGPEDVALVQVD